MNNTSPESLAKAIGDERLEFGPALVTHLLENCRKEPTVGAVLILEFVIGFACRGRWDYMVELPEGKRTVREIISEFHLEAFVELQN